VKTCQLQKLSIENKVNLKLSVRRMYHVVNKLTVVGLYTVLKAGSCKG